ncbi:hypothetical protein [Ferrimonas marina]|uniref:Uncharacterized protein n=1 Tax=Ferrimonas marina TaxID=299255 RepID=A0A1M5U011_9GAMM|nr:hypothetical protein [Ferrimonas marina]SHH55983.1 hypothetical protein SAMN02745129_2337 [Ferrimonas marina]
MNQRDIHLEGISETLASMKHQLAEAIKQITKAEQAVQANPDNLDELERQLADVVKLPGQLANAMRTERLMTGLLKLHKGE